MLPDPSAQLAEGRQRLSARVRQFVVIEKRLQDASAERDCRAGGIVIRQASAVEALAFVAPVALERPVGVGPRRAAGLFSIFLRRPDFRIYALDSPGNSM
jgi:hypothetical protein